MRATHIEKPDSLETDSFINAFARFFARRGVPEKVRPDNSTNFIGGKRNCIKQCGAGKMIPRQKLIFCRKRSSGTLIPWQLPIWEGYGTDQNG